jgi:hypothetical protein
MVDKFQLSDIAKKIVAIFENSKNHRDRSLNGFLRGCSLIDIAYFHLQIIQHAS